MDPLDFFAQNGSMVPWMSQVVPFVGLLLPLMLLDLGLKGWSMWRAARLGKTAWFIALLVVNSLGILPLIFLFVTNDEYKRSLKTEKGTTEPIKI